MNSLFKETFSILLFQLLSYNEHETYRESNIYLYDAFSLVKFSIFIKINNLPKKIYKKKC